MTVFVACNEEEKLENPPRLFRPIVSGASGGTSITLTWDKYEGTLSYTLDLSESEDISTIIKTVTTEETVYVFDNLEYNTQYYIRVQAFGNNIQSEPIIFAQKTSKLPTKLITPTANDVIDRQIRVTWEEITYDRMGVFIGRELVKTVEVSDAENEEKIKIITDLEPLTTYTVKVYSGEEYLGEMDYKTVSAQVFEGNYVDLRGLSAEEAYDKLTQTYIDELSAQYPDGFTLVLEGGVHYAIPGVLNTSVTTKIVTGLSFFGRAVWEFNGGIGIKAGANVPSITLEGLIVTDHPSAPAASANFGGKYLIDIRSTNADTKIGELNVINCDVRYKRGFLRAQAAVEIEKITVDNCFIDSIGGYGVLNADNDGAIFYNMIIKNTTIAHAEKVLVRNKANGADKLKSVVMENVTSCFAPKGTNYYFDFTSQTITGGITIKNCIFGTGWDTETPNGIRSSCSNFTMDNNFRASDLNWNNAVSDVEALSEATTALFADPAGLDFKVNNTTVAGKIGDPRWW